MGARRKSEISKAWLAERKQILQKIKGQVRLYLGDESKELSTYGASYKKDLSRPWTEKSWDDVYVCLQQVQVAFGGDFHPFAQAQRAHLRILRKMVQERPVTLALECLNIQDQPIVDQFMAGEISEEVFLDKVRWDQAWGFPWKHYKPLFDFAKKHGVAVIGLNVPFDERTLASLDFRDRDAADIILKQHQANPDHLIYVVYGDLHIAGEHLPTRLKSLAKSPSFETASLYLNSESIYFRLAEQGKENHVEVVAFNDREFCLLTSPPWVKWHSYLMYLEENFDIDLDEDDDEEEDWEYQIDHTDHVSDLVKMIATALNLEVKTDAIEVYSLDDPQAYHATEQALKGEALEIALTLIQGDRSFYIPEEGFFYLSKSTVNHAASLAGQYVHSQLSDRKSVNWSFPNDLQRNIWVEAMSFLLSKFVNPKRKAQTMRDLKKQLEAFDRQDRGREPLLLALDQKMIELLAVYSSKDRSQAFRPSEKSSYTLAARFIGEIMGERYFVLYRQQIIDIDKIRSLLKQSIEAPDFDKFYLGQLKLLDQLEMERE